MPDPGDAFRDSAIDALRWVASLRLPARSGSWWVTTAEPDALPVNSLYAGTAGVLHALAFARHAGFHDFDDVAHEAADHLAAATAGRISDARFYLGMTGAAVALAEWAGGAADTAFQSLADTWDPERGWTSANDLIFGDAGALAALLAHGPESTRAVSRAAARRLAALGREAEGGLDWHASEEHPNVFPGFSHGTAGVGYVLARAVEVLGDDELLAPAVAAGHRMVQVGDRGDGTWLAPHSVPQVTWAAPHSLGWCHGPTGSLRLFSILHRLQPGEGWDRWVDAARRTVRESGLPARRQPGFWDNIGQCCGTAGVGEMALDAYAETQDEQWLSWACELGEDVLSHAVTDEAGTRWSNTEHTAPEPLLEPEVGWMQGAAGISAFLLRLSEACAGRNTVLRLPDAI